MDSSKTILFSDFDGTLFNSAGHVSQENRDAIACYVENGGMFAVATGRTPSNALQYLGGVCINAPSIMLNGAAVYDFNAKQYLMASHLDQEKMVPVLRRVLERVPEADLLIYNEDGIFYCTPEAQADPVVWKMHLPCTFTTLEEMQDKNFIKCQLCGPQRLAEKLREALKDERDERVFHCIESTSDAGGARIDYFELVSPGMNKGVALQRMRALPEIAGRTVFAVGDYLNDLEMLQCADVAIAPANAVDAVKAVAQFVTVSNNEHAIAHILQELIPKL